MTALPTGTVTFLFTDIESSTAHWEHRTVAMAEAVARHDRRLGEIFRAQGGYIFKALGDAFCVAFASAPGALAAAIAAQRVLHAEDWNDIGGLRARMALHTGASYERDGDYFGRPVNRVARLRDAGHGGQILLSLATRELVRDLLPPDVALLDLGEHRLKDLDRPERVFQVTAPDLPATFPPLRTLDNRPTNLPDQRTPLVGRVAEVEAVRALLLQGEVRLVTLTGPGGTGKTRLGLQVAAETLEEFADGAYFVALAPISDPTLVVSVVAQTLGVRDSGSQPLLTNLRQYLRDKQLLLVLDNFEHVAAASPLVPDLLAASPAVKVLVTSREPLRLQDERVYPVPPLALPQPSRLPPAEHLERYEAIRFFRQRAQAVRPDFAITDDNAWAVAEICRRLDGLPLAIVLAAPWMRLLSPQALLARLDYRLFSLPKGARDLPKRQQTLQATIDWSYHLLDPGEQRLFAHLGVFAGGCTLEAAESIGSGDDASPLATLDRIEALTAKSLLQQDTRADGATCFVMLETIREYALEQLVRSGEADTVRRVHAEYYLALVEKVEPELSGPQQALWLTRLAEEHDNLRAALTWARDREQVELSLRLAGALWYFWYMHGHLSEGRRWLQQALASGSTVPASWRAAALNGAGVLAWTQGDYPRAAALHEEGLLLARELGDKNRTIRSLNNLGLVAWSTGDFARAKTLYEQSLALARELDNQRLAGAMLSNLGEVALLQGEHQQAASLFEESLTLRQVVRDARGIADGIGKVGMVALHNGDYQRAANLCTQSLKLLGDLNFKLGVAEGLEVLGLVAGATSQPLQAVRLWGAAQALRETIGLRYDPLDRLHHDRFLRDIRPQLDEATFETVWLAGRGLTQDEAIAEALTVVLPTPGPAAPAQGITGSREQMESDDGSH